MYPDIVSALATPMTVFGIAQAIQAKPSKIWQKLLYLLKRKEIFVCDWLEHHPGLIIPVYHRGNEACVERPVRRSTELPKAEKEIKILELIQGLRIASPIELTLYTGFSKPTVTQLCAGLLGDGSIMLVEVVDREHFYGINNPENREQAQEVKPRKPYRYSKAQSVFKKIDQQTTQQIERAFEVVLRPV